MITFTRHWVTSQMSDFWEEMVGIRPTLPARMTGQQPTPTVNALPDLTYAKTYIPFSELRAARLIRLQLEDRLTFAGEDDKGVWYFWNDVYHEQEESGVVGDWVVEAFTDQFVTAMNQIEPLIEAQVQQRIAAAPQNEAAIRKASIAEWKDYRDYQRKIHSHAGLKALKERFRTQCTKPLSHFDDDRRWLVCENGVIDLEGFRKYPTIKDNFRAHSPERPVTRAINCAFNPKATAPHWERFLESSIPDPEIREFLQRLVGAAFLAEAKVKAIPNLQGPKDCGKTIFVSTLEKLAGGYGVQPSPDALMQKDGTNFEQETLRGARFVGISEPSNEKRLDDTFCKQVTGGDEVRTRTLNQKSRPWLPQCVIFIASNDPINFNTNDSAFVERLCLVRFPHRFWDANEASPGEIHIKDYTLEEKLAAESEGIFLWVIMGMYNYLQRGIDKPESVKTAGDSFAVSNSGALAWVRDKIEEGRLVVVDEMAEVSKSDYVLTSKLYQAYSMDAMMDNERPMMRKTFSKHLQGYYGEEINSGGRRIPRLIGVDTFSHFNTKESAARVNDMGL